MRISGTTEKSFWIYDNDRKENTLIYAHHISYKNIRNFCRLFEPDYYTNLDKKKKNASKVPNNVLKSNCEFDGKSLVRFHKIWK